MLPEFRVRESPPFSRVGEDFAGPPYVKQKSVEMVKAYVALFTCCVTRAVDLELVEDLSAVRKHWATPGCHSMNCRLF